MYKRQSLGTPPTESCDGNTPRPRAEITRPREERDIPDRRAVQIIGTALGPNFAGYQVEYGLGENPGGWGLIQERRPGAVQDDVLAMWDTTQIDYSGLVTIRVIVYGQNALLSCGLFGHGFRWAIWQIALQP